MGESKELLALLVVEGDRKFEFRVMESGNSKRYLVIVAAKREDEETKEEARRIVVAEEHLKAFYTALNAVRNFIRDSKAEEPDKLEQARKKHPKAGSLWNEVEDAQLKDEFQRGMNTDEIATTHQRSEFAIKLRLERMGLISNNWREKIPRFVAPTLKKTKMNAE